MASSRIFVTGLPPSLTEGDFRKHFAAEHTITDAKLVSHRRIGYVGYKTPEDAAKAVKYFNRSFIRMSRIGVEIARPPSDISLPISRKAQREQIKEEQRAEKMAKATSPPDYPLLKRKRSNVKESDPKLKEFLEVMQPKSKSKTWEAEGAEPQESEEPPRKVQAIELPEGESDNEYEVVPKLLLKGLSTQFHTPEIVAEVPATKAEPLKYLVAEAQSQPSDAGVGLEATDEDWLRSRTNRLLDLVDSTDTPKQNGSDSSKPLPSEVAIMSEETEGVTAQQVIAEQVIEEVIPLDNPDPTIEAIRASGRLFVRNLPYSAKEVDLRKHFETYGTLEEVHLPLDNNGTSKGFALVQFEDSSAATEAYHNTDGEPFQGRLLHVLPGAAKRNNKLDEFAMAKLPLKKQKLIKKKAEASTSTFNWNSLYMSQDAVNSSIADRLGVSKSEMLDPTSADAGVKQAIAETSIILETKTYFANNGVDLNAFKERERGDTIILVKNFPYGMSIEQLRKMFEDFGQVLRVLMPPSGTIAVVEFAQASQARHAFTNLAYRRIQDSVLFLEKAPNDLFAHVSAQHTSLAPKEKSSVEPKPSASDLLKGEAEIAAADSSTLFVRNLNFSTTSIRLTEIFAPLEGFMSARVNTKTDPKKPGQVLSMGFGFVEFRSKAQAQTALKAMDGYNLDEHQLVIKVSNKGLDMAEERRTEDKAKKLAGKRTKIIIKNLPFEASKKDVRALFGTYGQLRSVRVPQKFDHSARGFAFADFITAREAENALEALKNTHLLGRRLVLEFAAEDAADAEEEIEKMQKKVGKQVSKVAIQKLTGGGRKKFNIEGNDDENDQ